MSKSFRRQIVSNAVMREIRRRIHRPLIEYPPSLLDGLVLLQTGSPPPIYGSRLAGSVMDYISERQLEDFAIIIRIAAEITVGLRKPEPFPFTNHRKDYVQ